MTPLTATPKRSLVAGPAFIACASPFARLACYEMKESKSIIRLFVLLAVAVWVIFFSYRYTTEYGGLPRFIDHSLPALAVGAVLFWWFGKRKG